MAQERLGEHKMKMSSVFMRSLLVGFLGWAAATGLFRLVGHWFFVPDRGALILVFLGGGLLAATISPLLRRSISSDPHDAAIIAGGLLLPGLVCDAAVTLVFRTVFSNLDPSLDAEFGALMLWGYSVILATVLIDGQLAAAKSASAAKPT